MSFIEMSTHVHTLAPSTGQSVDTSSASSVFKPAPSRRLKKTVSTDSAFSGRNPSSCVGSRLSYQESFNGRTYMAEDSDGSEEEDLNFIEKLMLIISIFFIALTFPFSMLFCVKVVRHFERIVIFRMGRVLKRSPLGPGTFFIIPCIDRSTKLDLRVRNFGIPLTDIMLQDSVQIRIEAVVWYKIVSPLAAVAGTEDYKRSTLLLSTGMIRRYMGYKNLTQVIGSERKFNDNIKNEINKVTLRFGVKIERIELKSMSLHEIFQRSMAAEGKATRDSAAQVLLAAGERNSVGNLVLAGNNLDRYALQLRYMQTLVSMERNTIGSTICFPIPIDFGWKDLLAHNRRKRAEREYLLEKGNNEKSRGWDEP